MNLKYDNNFNVTNICKYMYVDSNSDELNADITAEEVVKAVKSLQIKKSCGFDCIANEMIKVLVGYMFKYILILLMLF